VKKSFYCYQPASQPAARSLRSRLSQWPIAQITDSEPRPQGAGWCGPGYDFFTDPCGAVEEIPKPAPALFGIRRVATGLEAFHRHTLLHDFRLILQPLRVSFVVDLFLHNW